MTMFRFLGVGTLFFVLICLFALSKTSRAGKISELKYAATGKNLAALTAMPIKVFLPSYVPPGYVLFDYTLQDELKTPDAGDPNYSVIYLRDNSHWFEIESSYDIGDVIREGSKRIRSKSERFGDFDLLYSTKLGSDDVIKTPSIISTWLTPVEVPKDQHGSARDGRSYLFHARGLSPQEAVKIIKSLTLRN